MLVPQQSECLYFQGDPDLRAFIACNGRPLPIFNMGEASALSKVTGYVVGAPGIQFSVGIYDGREKRSPSGRETEVYFAQDYVDGCYWKAGEIEYEAAQDDPRRFDLYDHVRVDSEPTRAFSFSAMPMSDDPKRISKDYDFLDNVLCIKVTVRAIKGIKKHVVRDDADDEPTYRDRLKIQRADERCVDEKSEKGKFALRGSYGALQHKPLVPITRNKKHKTATYKFVNPDAVDYTPVPRRQSAVVGEVPLGPPSREAGGREGSQGARSLRRQGRRAVRRVRR